MKYQPSRRKAAAALAGFSASLSGCGALSRDRGSKSLAARLTATQWRIASVQGNGEACLRDLVGGHHHEPLSVDRLETVWLARWRTAWVSQLNGRVRLGKVGETTRSAWEKNIPLSCASVQASEDERWIAALGHSLSRKEDVEVVLYDRDSDSQRTIFRNDSGAESLTHGIGLQLCSRGRFAAFDMNRQIYHYSIADRVLSRMAEGHYVEMTYEGDRASFLNAHGKPCVMDVSSGRIREIDCQGLAISGPLKWSHDGNYFLTHEVDSVSFFGGAFVTVLEPGHGFLRVPVDGVEGLANLQEWWPPLRIH